VRIRSVRLSMAVFVVAVGALASLPLAAAPSPQNQKESFTGFAINTNSGPKTAVVDFTIERWSTDAERQQLLGIIVENKDPRDKLLDALQKQPKVGYIRTPTSLSWDLHYARQTPLPEGGRQIVLATDRPLGFWEVREMTRTTDYPFTIIEMRLDKEDKGEGKILVGTKIFIDKKKNLVLENYGQQPVRFNEIHRVK
jgi:hypothetical protein